MAEAIAAIGIAASIVELFHFTKQVVRRLNELREDAVQAPKAFENVRNRVPLMLDLVERIQTQVENGSIDDASQDAMAPIVRACLEQIKSLDYLLEKVISLPNNSAYTRSKKVISSMIRESELERLDAGLRINFDLLIQAATLQAVYGMGRRSSSVSSGTALPPYGVVDYERRPSNELYPTVSRLAAPIFMMPYSRDRKFLGRRDVLHDIELKFASQRQVALAGLGGVGRDVRYLVERQLTFENSKSQIAIEYCYAFHEKSPAAHVFWIYAGTRARFEQGYQEIARRLALPGWDEEKVDTLQLVCSWLSDPFNGSWLMIVDNADDATMFFPDRTDPGGLNAEQSKFLARYIPQSSSGSLLVTTRDKRVGERLTGRERPVEILPMSKEDAQHLLLSNIAGSNDRDLDNSESAARLVHELAYLPLAITQAAAFITENMLDVTEYLELLAAGDLELQDLLSEDLQDPRRDLETENSVIRTWKLSFDQLVKGKPRAAEILSLMAVLDYHATPKLLLKRQEDTEIGFRTALGALQAFSLISHGQSTDSAYKMHRLVAISTQKWLEMQGTLSYWQTQALKRLDETFPGRQSFENWQLLEALTPHAQLVFSFTFSTAVELLQCAKLLDFSALYDLGKGRYEEAHEKALKSLDIRQNLLQQDHRLTLDSVQLLGEAKLHIGELRTARKTLERAITGRENQLGPLHPDTLESISDLTITLLELGQVSAAEQTALRALEGRREVLGENHPDTLVSLNILAMVQQMQGNLEAASTSSQKVLDSRIAVLGEGHPDTVMTLNNLAVLRYRQGDLEIAKTMLEKAIAREERLLGKGCFDRQVSLTTLAFVTAEQGSLEKAEVIHREVLSIREKVYGSNHPSTLYSIKNIASTLEKRGLLEEAKSILQAAGIYDEAEPTSPSQNPGALLTSGLLFD